MKPPTNAFGYYGGKASLIDFISENVEPDPRGNFLDLFGGSGVVSFVMMDSFKQVVYNDIDGRLCNFFRTLRKHPEYVIDALSLTPASREDFMDCWETSDDPIEDARRVFIRINCSMMKKGLWSGPYGWQFHGLTPGRSTAAFLRGRIARLPEVAAVLQKIDIENRDWRPLVKTATKATTIFADPPYDLKERTGGKGYGRELSEQDHRDLAHELSVSPAKAIVCGYPSDLYDEIYSAWERKETNKSLNYQTLKGGEARKNTECLWIKPKRTKETDR